MSDNTEKEPEYTDAEKREIETKIRESHPEYAGVLDQMGDLREKLQVVDRRRFADRINDDDVKQMIRDDRLENLSMVTKPSLCVRCGHEIRHSDNEAGRCEKIVGPPAYGEPSDTLCGCICECPPEPHVAVFSPSSNPINTPGMDFPTAIQQVMKGHRVTRLEWENPEIWLMMFYWGAISPKQPAGKYLSIHHADGAVNPLVIGDGDLLGDDWVVVV